MHQLRNLNKLMSWNSYAKQVSNSLLKRLNSNINKAKEQTADDCKKIFLNFPYIGVKGDHLTKLQKLNKCFNENVKFIQRYKTNKLAMFSIIKDHVQFQPKASVVCRITCPGSYNKYIGKTNRNIITRMDEHGTKPDQPMYQHLTNCAQFAEYLKFYALPDIDAVNNIVPKELLRHHAVTKNTKITDHNDN